MKLIVKNNAGETVSIQIKSNETFMDLKERVEEEAGISLDLKDIALKGKRITETQRVMEYFLSYGEVEEDSQVNIYCAVPGCKNTKQSNPDKVFFEFPTDEIRCHQWVLYCQRLNAGPGKKRLSLTSESTICSDHFRTDQFVKNTNTLLKRTAVPCVKMEQTDEQYTFKDSFKDPAPSKDPVPYYNRKHESIEAPKLFNLDSKNYLTEESLTLNKDLPSEFLLCRLCSNPCDDYVLIFDEAGRNMKIAEKINLCLPVVVQVTDALPKQICRGCLSQLNELFELSDVCSLAQETLYNLDEASSINNGGLAVVSLDDTGQEVILGTSGPGFTNSNEDGSGDCCPLCKEGKMIEQKKIKKENLSDDISGPDPLNTSANNLRNNDSDCNFVNPYSESLNRKNSVNYDTSDLDSVDCSASDLMKDDPLKLDDNSSKSDNDQISDSYSSFTSPLNILGSEDSSHKNIHSQQLSPINEESELELGLNFLDSESENSSAQPVVPEKTSVVNKKIFSCRLCGFECHCYTDLFNHSLCHSFKGFYQCTACVTVFTSEKDLKNHLKDHEDDEISPIYCDVCSRSFKSAVSLASHICIQENSNGYRCPICKKSFRSESRMRHHMKFHDGAKPVICSICNKVFTDEIKLQKHNMYIHNNRKVHCCEECGKVFKSEASMKYHQRTHQSDDSAKPYRCEHCGKSFIRKSMLLNHMTSAHKHVAYETPCFTCKLCYEAFPGTTLAVFHMDNHHKLECMDESTYSFEMHTINRLFVCEFCDRCFAEGNVLNQHREQHPADAPYECKYCDTTFATVDDVINHRAEHLSDELPSEYLGEFNIPKSYLCEYCERCFLNQTKYSEHLTIHYGPEPYQCRHCSLKFPTLMEAIEHRSMHSDSTSHVDDYNFYRPYECHYCSKTFAIEDALIKHIRMHTGEKPFICDQCGKGFSQSSGLYTHQKVHSSERPYSCSVCPRTFKIKGDRDVHVRKHSGDRPYKCEFCGKAFMTQHVYSQHRKIHTGERPYKCDVCGIAFRRSHVLTVHKRIHTGEKPNICDICGKRYRQKGDMLKHRRVQHGIVTTRPINQLVTQLV